MRTALGLLQGASTKVIRVSKRLYDLSREYLDYVERGVLTEERSDAHDRMMAQMRAEGIAYRNREDARNKAYWFTAEPSIVIAYWKMMLSFLGEWLDEHIADTARTETSLHDLCAPC